MNPTTLEYLNSLESRSPADVVEIKTSMKFDSENKYVTVIFDSKQFPNNIEIVHITDVQFGHKMCNVPVFREYRDWILSVPNRFVFLGGDLVDAAHALSVASPYENTEEPQGQVYRFVEEALPMRHRILGYVGGNHERRSSKTFGDLGKMIATLLKIPYSSGKQFIDIHYGAHKPHRNSLWHGSTGARTKGAKVQMIHRFMKQGDSQIYWVGHLHDCLLVGDVREARQGDGTIHQEKYYGVMSSSFLEHYGTYAEVAGLEASVTQMWRLVLEPNGKEMLTIR